MTSPDRQRRELEEIARMLGAEDAHLVRMLQRPSRLTRLRWGRHRHLITVAVAMAVTCALCVVVFYLA